METFIKRPKTFRQKYFLYHWNLKNRKLVALKMKDKERKKYFENRQCSIFSWRWNYTWNKNKKYKYFKQHFSKLPLIKGREFLPKHFNILNKKTHSKYVVKLANFAKKVSMFFFSKEESTKYCTILKSRLNGPIF